MTDRMQRAIELVHSLDRLKAERSRITAEIDMTIAKAEGELAVLVNDQSSKSGEKENWAARRGRPGLGYAEKVVALLRAQPGADMGYIATEVYGQDSPDTRHRVRAQLAMLKDRGRVRRVGVGKWHAVDTEALLDDHGLPVGLSPKRFPINAGIEKIAPFGAHDTEGRKAGNTS